MPITRHLPRHSHHRGKSDKPVNLQAHFLNCASCFVEGGQTTCVRCDEDHVHFLVFAADVVDYVLDLGLAVASAN
jgi:hypothetical protein